MNTRILDMKTNIIPSILTGLLFLSSSCNNFLDIRPKGMEIASTTDHYNGLFNSTSLFSYQNIRNQPGGVTLTLGASEAPLYLGDDLFSSAVYLESAAVSQQNMFKWVDDIYLPDEEANEWGAYYGHLYAYNLVAQDVMGSTGGTDQKKKELLAEARACRAFELFMVSNIFGQPYNEATATNDLAVPIVTKPDITQTSFTRPTNREFYDFLIKELSESVSNLNPTTISRLRLSKAGGYYMLGMVYFQMREYQKALAELKNALAAMSSSTITMRLYNYNTTMNAAPPTGWYLATQPWKGASGYPLQYNSEEVIFLKQVAYNATITRGALYLKPEILNLYGSTDQRRKMFYNKNQSNGTITLPGSMRNSPTSFNYGPGLPNLYLMLAECKARTNDLAGCKADLELLRSNRMPTANATVTVSTQDAMIRLALEERHREFASTGIRWMDMRRLSGDAVYNNVDGIHTIDASTFTLKKTRLTMRIPPFILAFNPGMQDNP